MSTRLQFAPKVRPQTPGVNLNHPGFKRRPRKIESFRRGYPRLSAFVDSDRNFATFRCFGRLHARLLLRMQDEITEMENALEQLENEEPTEFLLTSRRHDTCRERSALYERAERRLKQYNSLLASYYTHVERPKPRQAHIRSFCDYMDGSKPLIEDESTFLDDWDDLRAPRPPADTSELDSWVENVAVFLRKHGLRNAFSYAADNSKSDDEHILFFDQARVRATSRALNFIIAVTFLTVPIVVLYNIRNMWGRLWAIAIFTAVFSYTLSWLTESRNYEILTATAAFCAVMVVFVGSLDGVDSN